MTECIPAEDGVIHPGHYFIPEGTEEDGICGGVIMANRSTGYLEQRQKVEYKLAMWVEIDSINVLHKTSACENLAEAKEWLAEMDVDFPTGKWFIIKDIVETRSVEVFL